MKHYLIVRIIVESKDLKAQLTWQTKTFQLTFPWVVEQSSPVSLLEKRQSKPFLWRIKAASSDCLSSTCKGCQHATSDIKTNTVTTAHSPPFCQHPQHKGSFYLVAKPGNCISPQVPRALSLSAFPKESDGIMFFVPY